MAIHDMWTFDHAPQGSTDVSTGSGSPVYATNTGTYFQYTGNPGYVYANGIAGAAQLTSDGYLTMNSSSSANPGMAIKANEVQDWSVATQYWVGFRTKTSKQNVATANLFAMSDTIGMANPTAMVQESDMTAASANTLNTEYQVEIFIDRVNRTFQVWVAGVNVRNGVIAAASIVANGNGFYWFGPWNSGTAPGSATRAFRDFYWLDVDGVDTTRLGSVRSSLAPLSALNAPNYTLNAPSNTAPVLSGSATIAATQTKFGANALNNGAGGATNGISIPSIPALQFTTDFTIEMWAYPTTNSVNMILAGKGAKALLWYASGPRLQLTIDGAGGAQINAAPTIALNTWHHIALTRQGNTWNIWLDGVSVGTYSGTAADSWGNNTNILYLANALDQSGWGVTNPGFAGFIDEVRISNIARYTTTFTPASAAFSPDTNTVALLHLDSNSGSNLVDSSVSVATPLAALQAAYPVPPVVTPNVISAVTNDPLTSSFASGLAASAKIIAVDYRVAEQASIPGSLLNPVLSDGTNNVALAQVFSPVSAMQFGQRLGLRRAAPDGGIWTPAKVSAASLALTPVQVKTLLLLHFDGTNGATTTTDAAGLNASLTMAGGSTINTAQSKFGTAAMLNGGSANAGVSIPDGPTVRFTAGLSLTIECWCRSTNNGQIGVLFGKDAGSPYSHLTYNAGQWQFWTGATGSASISANSGVAVNTWMHIALVFNGSTFSLYQNGVLLGSAAGVQFGSDNTLPFMVGNYGANAPWQGNIDEFRISALARYTSAFTPPTQAFVLD